MDRFEHAHEAIAKIIKQSGAKWLKIDTEEIEKIDQMAILISTWAGLLECRFHAEAWTDCGRAKASCTVAGVWKDGDNRSILPGAIRDAVPAWKGKKVCVQPEPILEVRLTLDGRDARDAIEGSERGRFEALLMATTTWKPGRVAVRLLSFEEPAPTNLASKPDDGLGRVLHEGFAAVAAAIQADVADLEALVTLDQIAAVVHRKKRTLERYLEEKKIPAPDFPGGDGKAHKWRWSNVRPALEREFGFKLSLRFPGSRII